MERPDQARFDHFSNHFNQIDARLEAFAQQYGWELLKNPLRKPERDLRRVGAMTLIIGVFLEGNWLTLDPDAPFLHTLGVIGIFNPVRDLHFLRCVDLAEHESFENITANLEEMLHAGMRIAEGWEMPRRTAIRGGGCYTAQEGWCVSSAETLKLGPLQPASETAT